MRGDNTSRRWHRGLLRRKEESQWPERERPEQVDVSVGRLLS